MSGGVGVIIQARMGSTRLPGKALIDIAGTSMLGRVVDRVRRAQTVDRVIVAIPNGQGDDPLAEHVQRLGVEMSRGSEGDVLDRYFQAARAAALDVVVRVTSDCPLLDPGLLDDVVGLLTSRADVDYVCNTLPRTYPRGLDVEAVPMRVLARVWQEARSPHERAHVFPYITDRPDRFRLASVSRDDGDDSAMRWTVDTAEDLEFVRLVCGALGSAPYTWTDVRQLVAAHPEWLAINAGVRQKTAHEA